MERTCLSAPSFPPRGGLSLIPSPKWPLVAEQVGHRAGREDGRPRHTLAGRALECVPLLCPWRLLCRGSCCARQWSPSVCPTGTDWLLVSWGLVASAGRGSRGVKRRGGQHVLLPSAHVPVATRSQRGKRQSARGLVPARHEQTRAGGPDPAGEATLGLRRLLTCSWPYAPQATPRVIQMPIPPLGRCPRLPSLVSLTAWVFFLPLSSLVPCSPSGKRVAPQWGLPGTRLPGP